MADLGPLNAAVFIVCRGPQVGAPIATEWWHNRDDALEEARSQVSIDGGIREVWQAEAVKDGRAAGTKLLGRVVSD